MVQKAHLPLLLKIGLFILSSFFGASANSQPPVAPQHEVINQRIIALSPHLVEHVFALGLGEQLVGVSEYSNYPEAAKSILRVGNYNSLNLEAIIALNPTLVLAWRSQSNQAALDKLSRFGIKVVTTYPETLADIAAEVELIGQHTHTQQQAQQLSQQFTAKLAALNTQFHRKAPVTVFYEMWAKPLGTVANKAWANQAIALCGGVNPFAQALGDYPQVSLEQVLQQPIKLIIQAQSPEATPAHFNWQPYPELPAVKHHAFVMLNADEMHRSTLRMVNSISALCHAIDQVRAKK